MLIDRKERAMKRITINLNEETYEKIEEMAKLCEMTPSQVIRAMMNVGITISNQLQNSIFNQYKKEFEN